MATKRRLNDISNSEYSLDFINCSSEQQIQVLIEYAKQLIG